MDKERIQYIKNKRRRRRRKVVDFTSTLIIGAIILFILVPNIFSGDNKEPIVGMSEDTVEYNNYVKLRRTLKLNIKPDRLVVYNDNRKGKKYLQRVVAGPKSTVRINDNTLFINGVEVGYIKHKDVYEELGPKQYYLLSDERNTGRAFHAGRVNNAEITSLIILEKF